MPHNIILIGQSSGICLCLNTGANKYLALFALQTFATSVGFKIRNQDSTRLASCTVVGPPGVVQIVDTRGATGMTWRMYKKGSSGTRRPSASVPMWEACVCVREGRSVVRYKLSPDAEQAGSYVWSAHWRVAQHPASERECAARTKLTETHSRDPSTRRANTQMGEFPSHKGVFLSGVFVLLKLTCTPSIRRQDRLHESDH